MLLLFLLCVHSFSHLIGAFVCYQSTDWWIQIVLNYFRTNFLASQMLYEIAITQDLRFNLNSTLCIAVVP
jgi:hypothetical protein